MFEVEQQVKAVRQALAAPLESARAAARAAALRVLVQSASPGAGERRSAGLAARTAALTALLADEALSNKALASNALGNNALASNALSDAALETMGPQFGNPTRRAALRLSLDALLPPPSVPELSASRSPRGFAVAGGAALGAAAGMFALAPGLHWLLSMRDVGLLLGGVLGAPLGAWAALSISRFSPLRRLLTKAQPVADWTPVLDAALLDWCEHAVLCIAVLAREPESAATPTDDADALRAALRQIGAALHALHGASRDELSPVATELLVAARLAGFTGLEAPPRFAVAGEESRRSAARPAAVWSAELAERYELFGDAETGDEVFIERQPVEVEGRVLARGLARRKRRG